MSAPRLLRVGDVLELTTLSRTSLYKQVRQGRFPKPRRVGPNSVRWLEAEVIDWLTSLPTEDAAAISRDDHGRIVAK